MRDPVACLATESTNGAVPIALWRTAQIRSLGSGSDRPRKKSRSYGICPLGLRRRYVAILQGKDRPIQQTARELIVLELYREGELSGGRAAEILHPWREDFIRFASERGVPYFQLDGDELGREVDTSESL